jgi:hypothetical protein
MPQRFLVTNREDLYLKLFFLGFILHTVFYSLTATRFPHIIGQGFQAIGLMLLFPFGYLLMRWKFESAYLRLTYTLYLIWLLLVVMRGGLPGYDLLKSYLFQSWFGAMLYLVPLIALLPRNLYYYKRLFDLIIVLGLVHLALDVAFIGDLMAAPDLDEELVGKSAVEVFSRTLGVPTGFILLTYPYHSRRRILFSIFTLMLIIVFGIMRARRGLIIMASLPLMFSYIMYLYQSQFKMRGLMIIATIAGALLFNTYAISLFNKGSMFQYLNERALEDTRTGVEVRFYHDFQTLDWVIGRGVNGKYYCPEVPSPNDVHGYREVIETDFLQIILKGGIISLALLMAILIPAMFLGFFQSNNMLAKASSIWIFMAIINMYPSTVNTFTLNYFLVWFAVAICYSKTIRMIPDEVLTKYFRHGFQAIASFKP